jgi:ribosomal protein L18
MTMFDAVLKAENAYALDTADSILANNLSKKKEEYKYTKKYATTTAASQTGLTAAEKTAAAAAASGPKKVPVKVIKLDPAAEAKLKKQIQDTRKAE